MRKVVIYHLFAWGEIPLISVEQFFLVAASPSDLSSSSHHDPY